MQPIARRSFDAMVIIVITSFYVVSSQKLFKVFPTGYVWSELMINFQGGFVRRGILGEIGYQLDPIVPAKYFLISVVTCGYCLMAVSLVVLARKTDILVAFSFLLSPVTLLLPIYDEQAYGRKDVFIVLALVVSILLVRRVSDRVAVAAILATYLVAGLIVETAWLYLPVAMLILTLTRGVDKPRRWHVRVWSITVLYMASCFAVLSILGADSLGSGATAAHRSAIIQSWQARYPAAYPEPAAVAWLGLSLREGVALVIDHEQHRTTLLSYLLSFCLGQISLLLFLLGSRPIGRAPFARLATAGSFLCLAVSFMVGADWGRYIHLLTIHAFVLALLTREPAKSPAPSSPRMAAVATCFVLLYGSMWQMKHFVVGGRTALQPGAVFKLLRLKSPY